MATRSNNLDSKILQALAEWESSAESPATVQEIAGEFGVSEAEAFNTLGKLEDSGKITGEGRGLTSTWWIGEPKKETPAPVQEVKPKRKRRTKAEMEAARAEERARLEYNTRAAESQDMVMSQALTALDGILNGADEPLADWERDAMESASKGEPVTVPMAEVLKAVEPVKDSQGETVTVPVDYDNPSAGRRELDASQGEKIIAEDDMRELIARLQRENAALKAKMSTPVQESDGNPFVVVFHEPKNGECPGNDIPPLPKGVNANVWEQAHDANTQSARDRWMREAKRQEESAKTDAPF